MGANILVTGLILAFNCSASNEVTFFDINPKETCPLITRREKTLAKNNDKNLIGLGTEF